MKKIFTLVLAIILCCTTLLSCGDDSKETDNTMTEEPTEKTSETQTETNVTEPESESELESAFEMDTSNIDEIAGDPSDFFNIPENTKNAALDKSIYVDAIFSNYMVLQADMPIRVWGSTTESGKICAVLTNSETKRSRIFYGSIENNEFEIWFTSTTPGGDYTLEIISESGKKTPTIRNITFGEVYILGGQSNMGWSMSQCLDSTTGAILYESIIKSCANSQIREMTVINISSDVPVTSAGKVKNWQKLSPDMAYGMSACGFFFATRLQEKLQIPVGVVSSCMGATSIEQWCPGGEWYNGMIEPIKKLVVRGVIWYQGENDYVNYSTRLANMINIWREQFQNPNMLFHIVQLPRYVNEYSFFKCREEQKLGTTLVDNCTYSVNIDTGMLPHMTAYGDNYNADGIHPYQKLEVGERAADVLLEKFYGFDGTWTSPYMSSVEKSADGSIIVKFSNVGNGLMLQGLAGFEVSCDGINYIDARPELVDSTTIKLTVSDASGDIKYVRYGYSNYSSFIEGEIIDCAQSVCIYNTIDSSGTKGYPAEQFLYEFN